MLVLSRGGCCSRAMLQQHVRRGRGRSWALNKEGGERCRVFNEKWVLKLGKEEEEQVARTEVIPSIVLC